MAAGLASAQAADIAWVWPAGDAPDGFREISVLAESLVFSGDGIESRPRLRPLHVAPSVTVTPTIHVHQYADRPPRLAPRHIDAVEAALLAASRRSTSGWVQLDFEPFDSQQTFYVDLVKRLRASLPATIRLSVTVRAAWCDRPALLAGLAADEVVPMFFRMGSADSGWRERLAADPESLAARCRTQAVGLARQEPVPEQAAARYQRRYWFDYRNWKNPQRGRYESALGAL